MRDTLIACVVAYAVVAATAAYWVIADLRSRYGMRSYSWALLACAVLALCMGGAHVIALIELWPTF